MQCELLYASYYSMFCSTLVYSFKRFIIYKLPIYKMEDKGSGVDYMYLDPSVMEFQMSKHTVNSSKGALGRTLTQLYSRYTVRCSYIITVHSSHNVWDCYKSSLKDTSNLSIFYRCFIAVCINNIVYCR